MQARDDMLLLFDDANLTIANERKKLETADSDVNFASVATEMARRAISDFTAIMARLENISSPSLVDVRMQPTDPTDRY